MTPEARHRVELLVEETRSATSYSVDAKSAPVTVRVELRPGERRIAMLSAEEHGLFESLLGAGPRTSDSPWGKLTYSPLARSWSGETTNAGHAVGVVLRGGPDLDPKAIHDAERTIDGALDLVARGVVRDAIATKLWRLFDEQWRPDDDSGPADAASFARIPVLRIISADLLDLGRATLELDDKELFARHSIMVTVRGAEVVDVEIAG